MNLPEKNFTAETHTAPPSSWVEMTAEAMASMLSNGAKLPLVVEDGEAGSIVVMELSRHPILSKHPARWNAANQIDDLKLISVAEAATTLNVSTRTVARLMADGQLVALKIRRRRLISAASIKQLLRI